MPKNRGFSLLEALLSILLLSLLASLAIPAFNNLLQSNRALVALHSLHGALSHARQTAVLTGRPVSVVAHEGDWAKGWALFHDDNNDGQQQSGEPRLRLHPPLEGVQIYPDETSRSYIHYRPQGQAIRPNGAFHAGHFRICTQHATAHRIVINRSGRIRNESAPSASLCPR
ncbi:GspH/FimT family protein [Pseudomonas citronellolis]|uniref:GspH/FimT family protein n=1 Tax=Pseudomonas TaxID=286 RepID=UPI00209CC3D2|nr:GspH/FimT family protein [Pseudomonas citronellolis]MCP1602779.1 type IV fimbrial biogenesis protein FimT [Pseudomonas citronellolis]MCP1653837.1 type IV fimbrial biogenesis protein FimT [Pseudomonas citronellolis]MCP1720782.1 type IV fimbrial biogenesis protein FimT [Pseudomonas citronellolis]MDN6871384.1 GspH/FimT family protein [Pseudomonas citronellolis]UXJ51803.1 GspH/FimT family protein [Pseudomonas citronellolis]